jgi:hypothetical protein
MTSVYQDIVIIVNDYLGPAGERFVSRQVEFHLKKKPEEVTKEDIPKLVEWLKVSIAMLTEDAKMVDDCAARVAKLAH